MRDHYEGTPLDITNDLGATAYKMPYRLSPLTFEVNGQKYFNERPISTQQSAFTFVAQMRADLPNAVGGVLWFGTDDANMMVFTPVYCRTNRLPKCYSSEIADCVTFSWESAFWISKTAPSSTILTIASLIVSLSSGTTLYSTSKPRSLTIRLSCGFADFCFSR